MTSMHVLVDETWQDRETLPGLHDPGPATWDAMIIASPSGIRWIARDCRDQATSFRIGSTCSIAEAKAQAERAALGCARPR